MEQADPDELCWAKACLWLFKRPDCRGRCVKLETLRPLDFWAAIDGREARVARIAIADTKEIPDG